jgi:diacylglycerol kinase
MNPPARARSFWQSLGFAIAGVRHAFRSQRNLRIHGVIAGVVIIAALVLRISRAEWAVVVSLIALVIGLELLNTAIEALVDLSSPTSHPLAKIAKDTAAGAILLVALGSLAVGLIIFLPRLWQLFF